MANYKDMAIQLLSEGKVTIHNSDKKNFEELVSIITSDIKSESTDIINSLENLEIFVKKWKKFLKTTKTK